MAVQMEETIFPGYFEARIKAKGNEEVGLLIGKLDVNGKQLVVGAVSTPPQESEDEQVCICYGYFRRFRWKGPMRIGGVTIYLFIAFAHSILASD